MTDEKVVDMRLHTGGYVAGTMVCHSGCGHEWEGVAKVGDTAVECPECHRNLGVIKAEIVPPVFWQCGNCGNDLFYLTPQGALCRMCGGICTDWAKP